MSDERFSEVPYLATDGDRLDQEHAQRVECVVSRDTLSQRRARRRADAEECDLEREFDTVVRFFEDQFAAKWWTDNQTDKLGNQAEIPFYPREFEELARLIKDVRENFDAGCGWGFHEATTEFATALSRLMGFGINRMNDSVRVVRQQEQANGCDCERCCN